MRLIGKTSIGHFVVEMNDKEWDRCQGIQPKIPGYVYLVRSAEGFHKIGMAKHVVTRIRELSTGNPGALQTIHVIKTDNMSELEGRLHRKFSDKRIQGEWFQLNPDDVAYVQTLGKENSELVYDIIADDKYERFISLTTPSRSEWTGKRETYGSILHEFVHLGLLIENGTRGGVSWADEYFTYKERAEWLAEYIKRTRV